MLFNSLDFAIFLPIVFLLYWFVTHKNLKLQNFLIVAASYLFYGWWDWRFLVLIIFSTLIDFLIGLLISRESGSVQKKTLLGISIFKMTMSVVMMGIGIVALAGIVVRNGILLVEFADLKIEEGMSTYDAILTAGRTRMTPVLLTAAATTLGLIPLAVGLNIDFATLFTTFNPHIFFGGDSVAFWGPLSWTMIFGLIFATFLTLILVPVMYILVDKLKLKLKTARSN